MPSGICLIERVRAFKMVGKDFKNWTSGDWAISVARAQELVGKRIYFHEGQAKPAYFGGVITGFTILPDDHPTPGRIVFAFKADDAAKGFVAGRTGWGNEQKTIP